MTESEREIKGLLIVLPFYFFFVPSHVRYKLSEVYAMYKQERRTFKVIVILPPIRSTKYKYFSHYYRKLYL